MKAFGSTVQMLEPDVSEPITILNAVEIHYSEQISCLQPGDAGTAVLCEGRPFAVVIGATSSAVIAAPIADVLRLSGWSPLTEYEARGRDAVIQQRRTLRAGVGGRSPEEESQQLIAPRSSAALGDKLHELLERARGIQTDELADGYIT